MWDVDVKAAVGRMTRPGAMLEGPYDIISTTRHGGAGIESCFGTRGACRQGLDPSLLRLCTCHSLFDRMIVLSILILRVSA